MRRSIVVLIGLLVCCLQVMSQECSTQCGVSNEVIATHPRPTIPMLLADDTLNLQRWWKVSDAVNVLDNPNGQIVTDRPQGDFFATVQTIENGWAQINDNEWIPASSLQASSPSSLGGLMLGENYNPPFPIAWLRTTVLPSRTPAAPIVKGTASVIQYQMVYVYADVEVDGVTWTQVGQDQWVDSRFLARVNPTQRPSAIKSKRWLGVDLNQQVLIAYEGATPVFASLMSTGIRATPTMPGIYYPYVRHRYDDMSMVDDSPFYYFMEDVPYVWYFNGNNALHGAYWHDKFGYRRSHGCINLPLTSAAWVYRFMSETLDWNTLPVQFPAIFVYGNNDWAVPMPPEFE